MILLFDIGKTNKKCFVLNEDYRIVFEQSTQLPQTTDEDGDPCEDLDLLKNWVLESVRAVLKDARFQISAIHCTTYGASFVHLDANGQVLTPLYNYLKPFPDDLRKQFFDTYGDETTVALETASPILGNLNSGLQLYWLKHYKPLIFNQIKWSLHLPQYVALLTSEGFKTSEGLKTSEGFKTLPTLETLKPLSEITSIGCHTLLWDFQKNDYHDWVKAEGLTEKFPPIFPSRGDSKSPRDYAAIPLNAPIHIGTGLHDSSAHIDHIDHIDTLTTFRIHIGTGLHDSSAALIPYLACFDEPFVLISTGTWCISLNPFNPAPLTPEELVQDCLCYLTYEGKPVKAARFFGGHEHEIKVKELAATFGVPEDFYKNVPAALAAGLGAGRLENLQGFVNEDTSDAGFVYVEFMRQLIEKQAVSTRLALGDSPVRRIFVDGGFSKNEIYITLLAEAFPEMDVFAAEIAQATALGAALAMHVLWNEKEIPQDLILLKKMRPFYKS